MHKRVLGCPIFIAVIFLAWGSLLEIYREEGNKWLQKFYVPSLFIIIPLVAYFCIRLTFLAEDEEIQTLNLKDSPQQKKELDSK